MSLPDPDLPIWQDLQRGNDAALDILMERHSRALFRFIYRYVLNEEDARDLLQETFVRAYFKRHQFQPRARVSTWLYSIALNLCRDHARSHAGRKQHLTEPLIPQSNSGVSHPFEVAAPTADPADVVQMNEVRMALDDAIQKLPHNLRAPLILGVLEDRPQKECAELLGISIKAVEMRIYRARKILETKLASFLRR